MVFTTSNNEEVVQIPTPKTRESKHAQPVRLVIKFLNYVYKNDLGILSRLGAVVMGTRG